MKPLTDNLFWEIVTEIGWPRRDIDAVKLMLMRTYPPETMEAMHITFCNKKAELARAAAVDFCCDSWDDTRAHIVGLGREEFQHNLDNPALILERESHGDYIESFAYCLPFPEDYELLTDSGYDSSLQRVQTFLSDLDNADPDEIPPRLYRRFPEARQVCNMLLNRKWSQAVAVYHQAFGPGYADEWPFTEWNGYLIPNIIRTLERYRLGVDVIEG